jgi:predicted metal-dependent HD superfamily phosphohydrolase
MEAAPQDGPFVPMRAMRGWEEAWSALSVSPNVELQPELARRYAEPHRAYHTLAHLEACFTELEPAAHLAEHLAEVQLALWFHDAIYDTQASDNEDRSASWAEQALTDAGADPTVSARVRDLVLATKHAAVPAGRDAELLVDVDLSILGADDARFDQYEAEVRAEYAWVPEAQFRAARADILRSLLRRPSLYATEWFRSRLETKARVNLERSIALLT